MHIVESWDNFVREELGRIRDECMMEPYKIRYYQVGTGGVATGGEAVEGLSSTTSLVSPLTSEEYGNSLASVDVVSGMLYSEASAAIGAQAFGKVGAAQGAVLSSLVSIILLDEETANGQLLDEVGLFVDNPYHKTGFDEHIPGGAVDFGLLGESSPPDDPAINEVYEEPGQLLAAYKKFRPILKESYFSLLIRWKINFSIERT